MNICVHTSFNRRGVEEPHVFFVGGHRLIVAAVLQCWVDHPSSFYEVTCDDGRRFLLSHDSVRQSWELAGVYAARAPVPAAKPLAPKPSKFYLGFFAASPKR